MLILGINGSPRAGGNCDVLLDRCLEGARDKGASTEKLALQGMDIAPCCEEEYFRCDGRGFSVIRDDMEKVFDRVERAKAIVVASPIFFGTVSAQTKAMIDRFLSVWVARNVMKKDVFSEKKYGAFISVAASDRKDFFDNARMVVRHFFATVNAQCCNEIFAPGFEKKAEVMASSEKMAEAYELGVALAVLGGGSGV